MVQVVKPSNNTEARRASIKALAQKLHEVRLKLDPENALGTQFHLAMAQHAYEDELNKINKRREKQARGEILLGSDSRNHLKAMQSYMGDLEKALKEENREDYPTLTNC